MLMESSVYMVWGCLDLIERMNYNEAPIVLAGVDRYGVFNI